MVRKWLAIGIILFLIDIALAPSIDANTSILSSEDDDLIVVLQTDKQIYQMGEPVDISIYVENHGTEDITIVFGTAQTADYNIDSVYLWSYGGYFPAIILYVTVPSGGQRLLLHHIWNQISISGNQVFPGTYQIIGWMVQSLNYPPIYAEPVYIKIGTEMNIGIHGGIGINVSISNIGNLIATNVEGYVLIKGGALGLITLLKHFDVENLTVNESISETLYPYGFGRISIEICATTPDANAVYLRKQMFVIIFFVYPINPSNEILEETQ